MACTRPSRLTAFGLAALLTIVLLPAALADVRVDARLDSMRSVQVEASGALPPTQAPVWRGAVDGDASGAVSNEEAGVFISVLDSLIDNPALGPLEAYNITWARENASGAHKFTVEGRARLAQFAFAQVTPLRFEATFDGVKANRDRVETTVTGLVGRVGPNATVNLIEVQVFSWAAPDYSKEVHRLDLVLPAGSAVNLSVGGAIEIVSFENVEDGVINGGRSSAEGNTTAVSASFYLRSRPVSDAAYYIALVAILGPAVVTAIVALWASPRHAVKDTPLPVEIRYK